MRAVVQRVKHAMVSVDGKLVSRIGRGLLVLIGIGKADTLTDAEYLSRKIAGLRIFPDEEKETSLSVKEIKGEIMLVSQFTLYGDLRKGKRPSFTDAMPSDEAKKLFEQFCRLVEEQELPVKTGIFSAMMEVESINEGPYTVLIDSKKGF